MLSEIEDSEYKQQISKFSTDIEFWHDKVVSANKGFFHLDEEFVELKESPTKFVSSDESLKDEENIKEW